MPDEPSSAAIGPNANPPAPLAAPPTPLDPHPSGPTPGVAATPVTWTKYHTWAVILIPVLIIAIAFLARHSGFLVAWVLNMVLLAGFIVIVGEGILGLKRGALIDERNKISLSRLQLCLWTVLILSALVTAVVLNVSRGDSSPLAITIPQSLWWLMGISTTSLIGSTLIKSTKASGEADPTEKSQTIDAIKKKERAEADAKGTLVVKCSPSDASWYDLFMGEEVGNGSHLDLGKVQMFYFTWVLVISYGAALADTFHGLSTIHSFPDLSQGMVALLGISHAGYLTNKALPHSKDA
jgi:hypothetical protein